VRGLWCTFYLLLPATWKLLCRFKMMRCIGAETLSSDNCIGLHGAGIRAWTSGCGAESKPGPPNPDPRGVSVVQQGRMSRREQAGADRCATFCWRTLPTYCCIAVKRASSVMAPPPPSACHQCMVTNSVSQRQLSREKRSDCAHSPRAAGSGAAGTPNAPWRRRAHAPLLGGSSWSCGENSGTKSRFRRSTSGTWSRPKLSFFDEHERIHRAL
jgi:hypothetical protein